MGRKIGFIAIGETIEFNGIKAVAVEAGNRMKCTGCIFEPLEDCPCTKSMTECWYGSRKDHKSIEFKEE